MNYEKKYKEALERASKLRVQNPFDTVSQMMEHVFPELRESEDEKIRKEIISFMTDSLNWFPKKETKESWIAWLEKQKDTNVLIQEAAEKSYTEGMRVERKRWLEKQGKQKFTDKVEPKFKIGDWITNGEYTWKVTDIKPLDYILQSQNGDVVDDTISYVDEEFHLWTIKDAKDGDVLAAHECLVLFKEIDGLNIRCYCNYHYLNSESFYIDTLQNKTAFQPATKEQCDLLFQKMKEAGYEWDAEKKELKKIEQESTWNEKIKGLNELETYILSLVPNRSLDAIKVDAKNIRYIINKEQKSAVWSEEDEKLYNSALWHIKNSCGNGGKDSGEYEVYNWLKSIKDRVQLQPKQEWSEEDDIRLDHLIGLIQKYGLDYYKSIDKVIDIIHWLKSLKPNHWKPSEEQMEAIKFCCANFEEYDALKSLYNDLKTLI